jgi:hypothetical protein
VPRHLDEAVELVLQASRDALSGGTGPAEVPA